MVHIVRTAARDAPVCAINRIFKTFSVFATLEVFLHKSSISFVK